MELDCFKDNCMPSDLSKCGGKMDRCVGGIQPVFEMGSLLVLSHSGVLDPTRYSPPGSSVHGGFSRQEHWSGLPCPLPGDLPNPWVEPRFPSLQAGSLLSELPGKPKNTGVGSLFLLQGIFQTQESNWDLLHCRWIFYQLS